jgi:hypothetical protein
MKYYESPISHIQSLDNLVLSEIPNGWRFGMEFFISPSPVLVSYQRIPKNGLVLTHIIVKNEFGDIEKTIEKEELEYWANLIGVENPPIIFQGKLSDEQKVDINDFINSPNDKLKDQYGTKSFAKFLIGLLNKDINKTHLNNSLEEPIEGVVFRFGPIDGTGDSFTAKILDPMFEDITKQNNVKKASYFPSDIYGITILDVMNFILDRNVDSFSFEGDDPQDKYISYISSVFNSFVEENGEKYLGLDFQEPEFLKQDGFNINLELIKDEKTKSLIEGEESYESLFKLILSAFRKIKKRPGGFFTQGAIEQFNILVREISNHLNNSLSVVESMIPTFDQFRNGKKTFVPQEETEDEEDTEDTEDEVEEVPRAEIAEDPVDDQSEDPVVIEAPKEVEAEEVAVPIDLDLVNQIKDILGQNDPISDQTLINPGKEVNIVIGKFQPFNNGHLKLIKKANQSNGLPVVIMVVNSPKNFIKGEIMDKMMSIISNELPDVVDSYKYIDNDLLSSALEGLHGKYNPKTLTIGTKRLDNYLLQARSLKKRKKLDKDFILQTAPEWVSSSEILNDLGEKNYLNFKKNVPKGLASIWEELTRCYESSK